MQLIQKPLTEKQKKFAEIYCNSHGLLSNTECAVEAGYAKDSAYQRSHELLNPEICPHVVKYIREIEDDIKTKFSKSNLDIIKKSNIDIDFWPPQEKGFDLIISNFYLNICEDLKKILSKIMKSLLPNGFFLATLPSPENFSLLRSAMMKTDMQLYGGTYNRFNRAPELHTIIDLLKKNNFKIPLVDYETIDLTYKQFNKLLNDVRSMNLSYYQKDKKNTFEKKSYFSKLEGNFEKENDHFNLKSNFYIISGWKDHSSQQKPIKPGQAKNKLADFL